MRDAKPSKVRKIPRFTFLMGGAAALAVGVPLLAAALAILARTAGVGDPATGLERLTRLAYVFAGFPAFLSGGGAARLAAHRAAESGAVGWRLPLVAGAASMGLAGAALAYLVAVPAGGMPEEPVRWIGAGVAGLLAGALTGLGIGALVALRQRRRHGAEATT